MENCLQKKKLHAQYLYPSIKEKMRVIFCSSYLKKKVKRPNRHHHLLAKI